MYQQPIYGFNPQPQRPAFSGLKGRPVSSIDEVRASTIDFDGSIFYFPDMANQKIYTKQVNIDGTATLNMYELKPLPIQAPPIAAEDYITRSEFNAALASLRPDPPTAESAATAPEFVAKF